MRTLSIALGMVAVVGAGGQPALTEAQALPPLTTGSGTPLFAPHSAFWVNLHHFLYQVSRARKGYDTGRPATAVARADTAGLGALDDAARRGLDDALAYYERAIADGNLVFDSALVSVNNRLAELEGAGSLAGAGLDRPHAEALEAAAPAYRAVWWPRHDAANRAWVDAMRPLVRRYGDSISVGVATAFRWRWPSTPIRLDVTGHANWAGAYTTERPAHITASSLAADLDREQGLEILFHEALHTMEDSVTAETHRAGRAAGKRVPRDLTHALIFYTAGEVTRRAVAGHVPYAVQQGLWERSRTMGPLLPSLRLHWQPCLERRASYQTAVRALVDALP